MGKGSEQSTTQQIDPGSKRFIEDFLRPMGKRASQGVMNAGPLTAGPNDLFREGVGGLQGAGQGLQEFREGLSDFEMSQIRDPNVDAQGNRISSPRASAGTVGDFGFEAGTFDPARAQQFLNPFLDEVVGAQQQTFDRQRQQALDMAAQEATQAGAFGGSRSGILQAEALGGVNRNEANQLAQLRRAGFSEAMQNALGTFGTEQNLALQEATGQQRGDITNAELATQASMQNAQIAQQNRGLGLQADIARARNQLDAFRTQGNLGLGALGQQAGVSGQIAGLGELQRQIETEQMRDPIRRGQAALGLAQQGFGGPTGGTTTQRQSGDLFGDILGAGLTAGGFLLGGPPGAAAGQAASGGGGGAGFGKFGG